MNDDLTLQSFFLGGFECATHRRRDLTRIDVIAATGHDIHAAEDYSLLAEAGIRTVRDGLRWHLIEQLPGVFDWGSFLPQLEASIAAGTEVIWDLCHWGVPDDLDPFSASFPPRFAAFAAAAAAVVRNHRLSAGLSSPALFCAINEISFWSWVGGDEQHFAPFGVARGPELKRNLIRASAAAIRAVRTVDPFARFVQPEPIIRIVPDPRKPEAASAAITHSNSQFEAWDMLSGATAGELGGSPDLLDVLGVNFYWNNEWIHHGDRTPPGHPLHRPLHAMLADLWARYHRPILITETGTEASSAVGWLGYVAAEVREARRRGIPIIGVCLYPVADYPGWDDNRHVPCGLIELSSGYTARSLRPDLLSELSFQQGGAEIAPLIPASLAAVE